MTFAVSSSKNTFQNAELQYSNAMALLKYSMNYPQDSILSLANSLTELDKEASQVTLGSIEDNSMLPLLQTQIQLSQCNVKNNKAGFLPSLSAYFQQSYNAYRTSFDFFTDKPWYSQTNWGIQMKIPVFSSGKGFAVVKQSEIQLMQDENNYQLTKQGLKFQEIQLKNTLESALKKRALQKENSQLAEKIYKNALNKEKIGNGNNVFVTQKLNQVMIAQAEYTASLIEVYRTKLELDKLYNKLTLK
jgi:outer membrane protein TolC